MSEEKLYKVAADPDFGKRMTSREPDALIDEKIFGYPVFWRPSADRQCPYRTGWQDFGMPFSVPYYHSDIKDAWKVVEELGKRGLKIEIPTLPEKEAAEFICREALRLIGIR